MALSSRSSDFTSLISCVIFSMFGPKFLSITVISDSCPDSILSALSELSIAWAEGVDRSRFGENILLNISTVGVSDNRCSKQTGLVHNPGYTMNNVAGKTFIFGYLLYQTFSQLLFRIHNIAIFGSYAYHSLAVMSRS